MNPRNIPNFNMQNRGFLRENYLENLKFRVANITDYFDNEETLVEHINEEGTEIFRDKSFKLSINLVTVKFFKSCFCVTLRKFDPECRPDAKQ